MRWLALAGPPGPGADGGLEEHDAENESEQKVQLFERTGGFAAGVTARTGARFTPGAGQAVVAVLRVESVVQDDGNQLSGKGPVDSGRERAGDFPCAYVGASSTTDCANLADDDTALSFADLHDGSLVARGKAVVGARAARARKTLRARLGDCVRVTLAIPPPGGATRAPEGSDELLEEALSASSASSTSVEGVLSVAGMADGTEYAGVVDFQVPFGSSLFLRVCGMRLTLLSLEVVTITPENQVRRIINCVPFRAFSHDVN
jgi:hypothetical protein